MRINKLIAERTGLSRRKADELVGTRAVLVNGNTTTNGYFVLPTDQVTVNGKSLPAPKKTTTIMFNKPWGYICSRDGQGNKTIYDILPSGLSQLKTIGRLDKNSSGLILLTNDGQLHHKLSHPSFNKNKVYLVCLDKPLLSTDKTQLANGIKLVDGISKLSLKKSDNTNINWVITMHEGRNRQIRRTFEHIGYRVTRLHRTQFGPYKLADLKSKSYLLVDDTTPTTS
jgi:23S rRNA pseudouridine2605 synthase